MTFFSVHSSFKSALHNCVSSFLLYDASALMQSSPWEEHIFNLDTMSETLCYFILAEAFTAVFSGCSVLVTFFGGSLLTTFWVFMVRAMSCNMVLTVFFFCTLSFSTKGLVGLLSPQQNDADLRSSIINDWLPWLHIPAPHAKWLNVAI